MDGAMYMLAALLLPCGVAMILGEKARASAS
jgi:hypothetical protein